MKKFVLVIALGLGGITWASAQTAGATSTSNASAPKAACCQKGSGTSEAKACCAKDAKATSSASCSGHAHDGKAQATAAPAAGTEQKPAKKTSTK